MKTPPSKSARKRSKHNFPGHSKLEPRNLLASIYHAPDTGILWIAGDNENNVAEVRVTGGKLEATIDKVSFSGADSSVTDIVFIGYDGNDNFTNFSSRSSTMYGHRGNDTLIGGSGDDELIGGPGDDSIEGNDGDDRLVGSNDNDTIDGGDGHDRIFGSAGKNTIYGREGNDTIYGSEDVDEIYGNEGIDKIYALGGDDMVYTGAGGVAKGAFDDGDVAMGHGGNDTFFGGTGLNIFYGGGGDDIMEGGAGENRMHGQEGDDTITGGDSFDLITGADGDDTLTGGGGFDKFNVGDGDDTIVYSAKYDPSLVVLGNETTVLGEKVSGATWLEFSDRRISANQADYLTADEGNFTLLNSYRTSSSRILLSKPQDLADYAKSWSTTMGRRDTLEHSAATDQRALLTDGRTQAGENVGWVTDIGQTEDEIAKYFHDAWRNSATHNVNMLNGDFSEVGIGIANIGGKWWATQIFVG